MVRSRHNKQGLLPQTPYDLSMGGGGGARLLQTSHTMSEHFGPQPAQQCAWVIQSSSRLHNAHWRTVPLIQHTPNCQCCSPLPLPWSLPFSFHNKLAKSLTFWDWDVCVWICNEQRFIFFLSLDQTPEYGLTIDMGLKSELVTNYWLSLTDALFDLPS